MFPTTANVLGILSLIFWSLTIMISIMYAGIILRADNRGEGGVLALMELVLASRNRLPTSAVVILGLFGAAFFSAMARSRRQSLCYPRSSGSPSLVPRSVPQ